ncbi:DUF1292 domain-containing protein [Laceyella putida]|jgi:nitroimidazol reductase NimA-like FMN-containing flavoprotein (pyridoxamine 5'-phosphate oxidase superfamily)|uniref:DUF1292 domain-containing protein n=1 Tax=Laceyella putida TaxID=110101 RepID=A0ABW2RKA4_9BACL
MGGTEAREVQILRQQLANGQMIHQETPYHLVNEVDVAGQHYALLRKADDHPDDAYLFRVNQGALEEIEDDNEWENIAEAVDEMLYFHEYQ